jgi:predicted Fe-Mo cluster-binding NifX family protein
MLAIPIFRSRVAPVLNWCSKVLIVPEDAGDISSGVEVLISDLTDPFERLRMLQNRGVRTLICGALSPELLSYADQLEMKVICGVSGRVPDVLTAYRGQQLDEPRFRLPGCRLGRCYRGVSAEVSERMAGGKGYGHGKVQGGGQGRGRRGKQVMDQGAERSMGRGGGRSTAAGAGPGGNCVCPQCGATAPHTKGIPCAQIKCAQCGQPMAREGMKF